jgi:hypothetical protein
MCADENNSLRAQLTALRLGEQLEPVAKTIAQASSSDVAALIQVRDCEM